MKDSSNPYKITFPLYEKLDDYYDSLIRNNSKFHNIMKKKCTKNKKNKTKLYK